MINKTKETIENELKQMWEINFLDNREFIDLFFDYFYNDENVFYSQQNGEIISCLYLLPFFMNFLNTKVKTSYLCGATTYIDYRQKGQMKIIIERALNNLYENDVAFCALSPANGKLFEYYKKLGFFTSYYNKKITISQEREIIKNNITFKESKDALFFSKIYSQVYYQQELSISRDKKTFEFLIKDYGIAKNTKVLKIFNNFVPCGYLFYKIENGQGIITEFCFKDVSYFEFKNAVLEYFCVDEIKAIVPSYFSQEKGKNYKIGMIRIVNLYKVLCLFANNNPDLEIVFSVKDELILQNNGSYKISDGIVSKTNEKSDKILDINDISSIIFNRNGYINLLLI